MHRDEKEGVKDEMGTSNMHAATWTAWARRGDKDKDKVTKSTRVLDPWYAHRECRHWATARSFDKRESFESEMSEVIHAHRKSSGTTKKKRRTGKTRDKRFEYI